MKENVIKLVQLWRGLADTRHVSQSAAQVETTL